MRQVLASVVLIGVATTTGCGSLRARGKTSVELIDMLEMPNTSRRARETAALELARRPPAEVLPGVFRVYRRHANFILPLSYGPSKTPATSEELVALTAQRAWLLNLENANYSRQDKGIVLLDLLVQWQAEICHREDRPRPSIQALPGRYTGLVELLHGLRDNWVDGAEERLASIVANPAFASGCRLTTAHVLVEKTQAKHIREVMDAARSAPLDEQESYARLLLDSGDGDHVIPPEWESRVMRYAVAVIHALRAAYPDHPAGYFIARSMEGHAGTTFTPKIDESSTREDFHRITVENALGWWQENQGRYPE